MAQMHSTCAPPVGEAQSGRIERAADALRELAGCCDDWDKPTFARFCRDEAEHLEGYSEIQRPVFVVRAGDRLLHFDFDRHGAQVSCDTWNRYCPDEPAAVVQADAVVSLPVAP